MKYLLILILLIPIIVFACPHYDEDGNLYYLYYEPGNPDNVIMAFQREKHYQIYYYNENQELIKEQFEIKIFEAPELYNEYQHENDRPYLKDEIRMTSEIFDLTVPLTNIRKTIDHEITDDMMLAYYIIDTKIINQDINQAIYKQLNHYFEKMTLKMLDLDILYINSHELYNDRSWEAKTVDRNLFLEPIVLNYKFAESDENFSIIKVNSLEDEEINFSEIKYEIVENQIVININEAGYYVFVEKQEEFVNQELAKEEISTPLEETATKKIEDDIKKPMLFGILSNLFIIILSIGFIIYVIKKMFFKKNVII